MSPLMRLRPAKTQNVFVLDSISHCSFQYCHESFMESRQTYLPWPEEPLILLPDAMSNPPCTGWVLYTTRENKLLPVTYCSSKLKDYMIKWFPCEKEAVGTVLAIDQCSHWINESKLTSLVGPDCSSIVEAAELMRQGKYSMNQCLQSLLSSVNC